MKARFLAVLLAAAAVAATATPSSLSAQSKRILDHDVYETWDTIGGATLSRDGRWLLYNRLRYDRDGALVVRPTGVETQHVFERAVGGAFDAGGQHVVFNLRPARDSLLAARRARRRPDQMPRDTLAILTLATGAVTRIPGVSTFRLPEDGGGWVAYQLPRTTGGGGAPGGGPGGAPGEARPGAGAPGAAGAATPGAGGQPGGAQARRKDPGTPLMLRSLTTGDERTIDHVASYAFSRDGRRLAYATSTPDSTGDGVYILDTAAGTITTVLEGEGQYSRLVFDRAGEQLAFLSNRDEWADTALAAPAYALYHWQPRLREARPLAAAGTRGMPDGWWVSENGSVSFSHNGQRILFGTSPQPPLEDADSLLAEERVRVDIWHWADPQIQPVQLRRAPQERRRTYQAVVHLRDARVVQLADETVPDVNIGARGDADVAVGTNQSPYAVESSWDTPGWSDQYLIDVRTGERTLVRERAQGGMSLSPGARYAAWYDNAGQAWMALDVRTRRVVELTTAVPYAIHNEEHDQPSPAGARGTAGWLENDAALIVYDRYDVWAVDPTGRNAPRSITHGIGRRDGVELRVVRLDREQQFLPTDGPLLLAAFNPRTKQSGFYRGSLGNEAPTPLVMQDYQFSTPQKAATADVLLFSRQSFTEFPDLWTSSLAVTDMRRVTAENPQQAQYNWGTAELVEWTSLDGIPLQGILYKPENFDPSQKYPMISYFYERMSDGLHQHYAPVPHRSRINFTFYTSRGYLVFVPDIVYRIGYPGESAMNTVMPGVMKLLERPYVDRDNLALQGHSWGGYQIAFMVTRTNLFRAAAAGAPVANMTSAYGGIRWESGLGRQFQYERTQSRLGGTLWEMPMRFIENSPLFWLDKVETPLLILHNDNDGAVPWEQGIELYLGLRRLGKPAWLVNYNDEPHWPTTPANKRDWNIRMQQFFDHWLKGAPPAPWIQQGIPATQKGRTLGY